jgi:hypothetical protein
LNRSDCAHGLRIGLQAKSATCGVKSNKVVLTAFFAKIVAGWYRLTSRQRWKDQSCRVGVGKIQPAMRRRAGRPLRQRSPMATVATLVSRRSCFSPPTSCARTLSPGTSDARRHRDGPRGRRRPDWLRRGTRAWHRWRDPEPRRALRSRTA